VSGWRQEQRAGYPGWYRIYDDGTVVAYGFEREPPRPGLMIASLWSAHPLDDPEAKHVRHLCVDATPAELKAALREYESQP
jgi:hypothetical protein